MINAPGVVYVRKNVRKKRLCKLIVQPYSKNINVWLNCSIYEEETGKLCVKHTTMKITASGLVKFYQPANGGVLVEAEFFGLPSSPIQVTHYL